MELSPTRVLTDAQHARMDKWTNPRSTVCGWDPVEHGPIIRVDGTLKVIGINGRLRSYQGV